MTSLLFRNTKELLVSAGLDWVAAPVKAALVAKNTWTPDATDGFMQDVLDAGAVEVAAAGYARVALTTAVVVSGPDVFADADDFSFDGPPAFGDDYDTLLLFLDVTDDTDSPVLAALDLGSHTTDGLPIDFTVDVEGLLNIGGGTSPMSDLTVVRFPFAFDTPDLVLTGVTVYTPSAGDMIGPFWISGLSIPIGWDGSGTPTLHWGNPDDPKKYDDAIGPPLQLLDEADGPPNEADIGAHAKLTVWQYPFNESAIVFQDDTPFTIMVDDGADGDPGSTQGEAVLNFVVVPAL